MTADDREMREYARKLFADPDTEQPTEQPPTRSNVVPREGNNPSTGPTRDEANREFARELFDRAYFIN